MSTILMPFIVAQGVWTAANDFAVRVKDYGFFSEACVITMHAVIFERDSR